VSRVDPDPSPRAARATAIAHYATAAVLALKGVAKLDHPEGHGAVIALCFGSAAVIVLAAAFHGRLHAHVPKVEALIFVLEAAVAAAMSALTFHEGKRGLPWAWAAAALGFLVAAGVRLRRTPGGA